MNFFYDLFKNFMKHKNFQWRNRKYKYLNYTEQKKKMMGLEQHEGFISGQTITLNIKLLLNANFI